MGAAVFLSALFLSMSAAVAHADRSFVLVESQARAGDVVHFSITGTKGPVRYEVAVADRNVVDRTAPAGAVVSDQFTMPDLGDSVASVKVKAEIREWSHKTSVKRQLQYLGPAPVAAPPAQAPPPAPTAAAAPVVTLQALPNPEPVHAPAPVSAPVSPAATAPRGLDGATPRRHPARHTTERQRATHTDRAKAKHDSPAKKKRAKRRLHPRTAPLFDGVPELGSGGAAPGDAGYSSLNAIAPPTSAVSVAGTGSGGLSAAIAVPGLLGLAALALVGATLHRRRRLARPAT